MDITNIDGANGNEAPGVLNEANLINECANALSDECSERDFLHYYPHQRREDYADAVMAVLNVLRKRGLLNLQALELLQRDGDLTPL